MFDDEFTSLSKLIFLELVLDSGINKRLISLNYRFTGFNACKS